jgi:hypothetical protein
MVRDESFTSVLVPFIPSLNRCVSNLREGSASCTRSRQGPPCPISTPTPLACWQRLTENLQPPTFRYGLRPIALLLLASMGLLDLPPEILDCIITFSAPTGLEGLVLSCKAIYERANSQIKEHNALIKTWRHAANNTYPRYADSLRIIYEISQRSIIAEYIEHLSLWDRRQQEDVAKTSTTDDHRSNTSSMLAIKDVLNRTEYFRQDHLESYWNSLIDEDNDMDLRHSDRLYATIALLALLPNIKTLQLPDRWHEVREGEAAEDLLSSVDALISMSNAESCNWKPLQSLETLLPFVEEGYDVRVGLQCLQPFMALKSIRNIYAVSCVAVDEDWGGIPFEWRHPGIKSPLTRLEFASCCMDGHGLSTLLSNTPALKVFKYSHQTKWDGLQHDWNPGEFLQVIASHCGRQLTDLALTIDELHGDIINGLSSFYALPKLERLEVDVQSFCGPPLESGQRLGRDSFIPEGAIAWTHSDIPCLGDMLPGSIREVYLNTDFPDQSELALKCLVKNIVNRRSKKLRILSRVTIRQYMSSTAQDIADRHNITLEPFDMNTDNPRPRSMMPLWKREFAQRVGGIVTASGD